MAFRWRLRHLFQGERKDLASFIIKLSYYLGVYYDNLNFQNFLFVICGGNGAKCREYLDNVPLFQGCGERFLDAVSVLLMEVQVCSVSDRFSLQIGYASFICSCI